MDQCRMFGLCYFVLGVQGLSLSIGLDLVLGFRSHIGLMDWGLGIEVKYVLFSV